VRFEFGGGCFLAMADIFLSYANEDRDKAAQVAALLEDVGWRVWWDRRIPAGRSWRAVLEEALVDMRCMIVLWSESSINSPWVAEEAEESRRLGKALVPVLIERVEPPMGFRAIQAADLSRWDGSAEDSAGQMLIADLKSLLGPPRTDGGVRVESDLPPKIEDIVDSPWYVKHWPKVAIGVFSVAVLAVVWVSWPDSQSPRMPPTQIKSADPAPLQVTHLSVRGSENDLKTTQTVKLTAVAKYSDGSENEVTAGVRWTSTDTRVATIDEQGVVKALHAGTTRIKAKVGDVESPGWTVGVADAMPPIQPVATPSLVRLSVSAGRQDLFERERVPLRARGRYSDDSEKSLTRGIEWQVSDRTVASVSVDGELLALRPGKVEVVARSDGVRSEPFAVTVKVQRKPVEPPPKVVKAIEMPAVKLPAVAEESKARIAAFIRRAGTLREEGNYAAALAELEKARNIDATNEEIRKEIEQTKRACNAEKVLGNKPNC
jgi:hypothetical protein